MWLDFILSEDSARREEGLSKLCGMLGTVRSWTEGTTGIFLRGEGRVAGGGGEEGALGTMGSFSVVWSTYEQERRGVGIS